MTTGLDEHFHNTTRLKIAAFLSGCAEAEFRAVQKYCDLSPSALSKNAASLEQAGYVTIRKGYVGKMPRTWLSLTTGGSDALTGHLATLRDIAESAKRYARGM